MKKGKLLIGSVCFLSVLGLGLIYQSHSSTKLRTTASENLRDRSEETEGAAGASAWWFNMRKDENGQMNYERMAAVRELIAQRARMNSKSMNSWPLTFSELGPDNVGGRTRAICIDRNDHTHMFAGGVSGGLWESHDGGSNWGHNLSWDQFDVLTITTIVQAVNGDWYFGTGETFITGGEFIGGGIWKSTNNGITWRHLTSTGMYSPSSIGARWCSVGKLAVDPINFMRIYAGTESGLMVSSDSGATFLNAAPAVSGTVPDVDVASNQAVFVASTGGNVVYKSPNGNPGTYTRVSGGFPQSAVGRSEIAISPSDPNYIYIVCGTTSSDLKGVYASVDGGNTFTQIGSGPSSIFNPFGTSPYLQAWYDMTLVVDPWDKGHITLGGVSAWEWRLNSTSPLFGQWTPLNSSYLHSDMHIIVYHPTNPGEFFIGCDGGVYRTLDNGLNFIPMNKHYNVTQCYAVACDYSAPTRNLAVAGCQDNGTQFIDGLGNTTLSATSINGGDGFYTEFSFLDPNAIFSTIYYGSVYRSANRGGGSALFYNARINAYANPAVGSGGFANFVTPIRLWESLNDPLSQDTTLFAATRQTNNIAHGNGTSTNYTYTLNPNFYGDFQANASIIPGTVVVTTGTVTLQDHTPNTMSGTGGSGTINYSNKALTLTFTTPPASSQLISVSYEISYNAGSSIAVRSKTNHLLFNAICPITLSSQGPNDTIYVKDVIQSKLVTGFTSYTGLDRGVFVTRGAIDFSTDPVWIKVAGVNSIPDSYVTGGGGTTLMEWSPNGNTLYVVNDNGSLYRLDNVSQIRDTIQGDVDVHVGPGDAANPRCPVRCTRIGTFPNAISAMDIDPNNPDNLLVTTGGYTPGAHVYLSTTATTAPSTAGTGNFTDVSSGTNLPAMPVYACSFDKYHPAHVLIGTEYGAWSTDNINLPIVSWNSQNAGFARVPVMQIRQSRWDPWNNCQNSGVFYLATYGRGMWKSEASYVPMGIPDHGTSASAKVSGGLNVYPNPMNDHGTLGFNLAVSGTATIRIYSLTGKFMKQVTYKDLAEGAVTLEFDSSDLSAGTYLLSLDAGAQHASSRFLVIK